MGGIVLTEVISTARERFLIREDGNYYGTVHCADEDVPAGTTEVAEPPADGRDKWTGTEWDTSRRPVPKPTKADLKARLSGANSIAGLRSVIADMLEGMGD